MLNTITSTFPMPKKIDFEKFHFFIIFLKDFSLTPLQKWVQSRVCVLNLKVDKNQNPSENDEKNENFPNQFFWALESS